MQARQVVVDTFFDHTAQREGFTPFPYCDILNLVTSGVGNLIDAGPNHNPGGNSPSIVRARLNNVVSAAAMAPAMRLPWRLRAPGWTSKNPLAGTLVSPAEVADAWTKVKRHNEVVPDFAQRGGFAYKDLTNITLDMASVKQLFNDTLRDFDGKLSIRYPGYSTWPADAQMAILSMAWGMGPNFNFPAFKAAVDRQDFRAAAIQSFFKGGGGKLEAPGQDPMETRTGRNAENFVMFHNAADVLKGGVDRDRLFFPGTVGNSSGAVSKGGSIASTTNPRIGQALTTMAGLAAVSAVGWSAWELFGSKGKKKAR